MLSYQWVLGQVDLLGLHPVSERPVVDLEPGLSLGQDAGSPAQRVQGVGVLVIDGGKVVLLAGRATDALAEPRVLKIVQNFIGLQVRVERPGKGCVGTKESIN